MSVEEIHVDDIGTIFEATVKDGTVVVDISTATTKEFFFEKPDGTTTTVDAEFSDDGVDGKLKYTTEADDDVIDVAGRWKFQVHVILTTPVGAWKSSVHNFMVYENLV